MNCVGSNIKNTDIKHDSGEVQVCNQGGCLCTAHLNSAVQRRPPCTALFRCVQHCEHLHCVEVVHLRHNEGEQFTSAF